jgi:Zn-dependent M28 family amino/carboxypeptidase
MGRYRLRCFARRLALVALGAAAGVGGPSGCAGGGNGNGSGGGSWPIEPPPSPPPARDAAPDVPPDASAERAPGDGGPPAAENALIAEAAGRIDLEEVRALTRMLQDLSQPNRATGTESYRRVTEWIRQLVNESTPALEVRFDERGELRNVELKLPGSDPAAGVYIVGGHLDSVRRTPGIDDNGSGSLGTALVARALGRYRFKAEIRFVLFDAEENGLVGSTYYARNLSMGGCAPKTCLKFFLNMDMIGHDPENRRRVQVFTAVDSVFQLLSQTEQAYQIGLTVNRSSTDSCNSSDDCSFSRQGYDTGYVFEAKYFPMRHTPADTVDVINFETMTKILKLVTASIATVAGLEGAR